MSSFIPKIPRTADTYALILPGISSKSHRVCEELLVKNNKQFHVFFNDRKFHNHFSHHLLAAYSLGGSSDRLQQIYDKHKEYQRKFPELLKEKFDRKNYQNYLGKAEAYGNFLVMFQQEIEAHGPVDTVRRWVWSGDLLARTVGGAYHPLIHIGYGLEFDLPGTVAEGLAMAACTTLLLDSLIDNLPPPAGVLTPIHPVTSINTGATAALGVISQLSTQLSNQLGLGGYLKSSASAAEPGSFADNPLIGIVQEIQQDKDFDAAVSFEDEIKSTVVFKNTKATEKLKQYAARWQLLPDKDDLRLRMRELYEAIMVVFGSSGIRDKDVRLDFFLMHALTSVHFVHHYLPLVSCTEGVLLLRSHLVSSLAYYVARGRPILQIDLLLNYQSPNAVEGELNPWNSVFDRALKAEEEHVIKTVRACAVGHILYGHRCEQDPYENAWLKAAQLALDQDGHWDFAGIGFDEAWK
ncbi:hypothetical protein DFQ28_002837 [Apophysomyces sp. BC1034]|nr:hypothetical protein DFQ29_002122 [Apophysomyces sp. BC1021]KAG0189826.1 hypothetical protein DFQ28_002837 [Apophysomyces sp. BC1034]